MTTNEMRYLETCLRTDLNYLYENLKYYGIENGKGDGLKGVKADIEYILNNFKEGYGLNN